MYQYKTEPFKHQGELWERTRDLAHYALFWEQGTGKTKPTIDTAGHLFERGEIDTLLVLAPNGVHLNWLTDELPKHMPDALLESSYRFGWQSKRATTKKHQRAAEGALKHRGLVVVAMAYDAIVTARGKAFAKALLTKRKCFYVLDESARIKTPGAKRTKTVVASGKHAAYRRILTGTPISNNPFDVYSQMRFLDPDFWKPHGLGSFEAFKTFFGVWEEGYNGKTDQRYKVLSHFRNLELLKRMLQEHSSRVTKDDVLDLPPKLYSKRYHDLTPEQGRLYRELRDEFETELLNGDVIEVPLALVRLLRLQQVVCGYIPSEDGERMHRISESNPRADLLADVLEDIPHAAIIWARFKLDIDLIMDVVGDRGVRYDGQVEDDDRLKAKQAFQNGDAQFFVATPDTAGEGLTLTQARTVIYYSNGFKLSARLQSEDRAHRIGQEHPVQYIDFVAPDTVDEHIVEALRNKQQIASLVMGDRLKEWL